MSGAIRGIQSSRAAWGATAAVQGCLVSAIDWLSAPVRAAAIERTLKAGQTLFRSGARTAGLYEVTRGKIRLVRVDRVGREAVLHVASAGDTLAEASLFSATYHCDAIATTEAVVRLYPKGPLLAELERNPKVAQAFAAMLARQVMTLRTRLEQRNILSARDRVRHYLTVHADPGGRTVALSGTLKDVAGELGLTHEALYRTLADMATDGEIERRKGTIRLMKPAI
jgi:CRP/FNR family transcriptional regulator, dissimilatory nitrate respiration regulator